MIRSDHLGYIYLVQIQNGLMLCNKTITFRLQYVVSASTSLDSSRLSYPTKVEIISLGSDGISVLFDSKLVETSSIRVEVIHSDEHHDAGLPVLIDPVSVTGSDRVVDFDCSSGIATVDPYSSSLDKNESDSIRHFDVLTDDAKYHEDSLPIVQNSSGECSSIARDIIKIANIAMTYDMSEMEASVHPINEYDACISSITKLRKGEEDFVINAVDTLCNNYESIILREDNPTLHSTMRRSINDEIFSIIDSIPDSEDRGYFILEFSDLRSRFDGELRDACMRMYVGSYDYTTETELLRKSILDRVSHR